MLTTLHSCWTYVRSQIASLRKNRRQSTSQRCPRCYHSPQPPQLTINYEVHLHVNYNNQTTTNINTTNNTTAIPTTNVHHHHYHPSHIVHNHNVNSFNTTNSSTMTVTNDNSISFLWQRILLQLFSLFFFRFFLSFSFLLANSGLNWLHLVIQKGPTIDRPIFNYIDGS